MAAPSIASTVRTCECGRKVKGVGFFRHVDFCVKYLRKHPERRRQVAQRAATRRQENGAQRASRPRNLVRTLRRRHRAHQSAGQHKGLLRRLIAPLIQAEVAQAMRQLLER